VVLKVDTFPLSMYAGIVENHQQDSTVAWQFADKNLQIGSQPGLIADLVGSHEDAKRDVVALRSLDTALEASGAELDRTWRMYDQIDRASAQQLDHTYPDPGGPPQLPDLPGMPSGSAPQAVLQTTFPSGRLTGPKKPDGFINPIQLINDLGNMISPGYWAQKFLEVTIRSIPCRNSPTGSPVTGSSSPRPRIR
jgi:hypothetical protein